VPPPPQPSPLMQQQQHGSPLQHFHMHHHQPEMQYGQAHYPMSPLYQTQQFNRYKQ
jgi:hypothetical protein